ncbi:MAG: 2,3-bisphosphoglycerate-independent phosphoglycerate mutase [Candidatus Latescibacterota bacterium]|nr:2,3-bisphosphoglycerate-independent phosphoglycerate mutase [Candidatus Latescibacterota bacterium]
MISSLYTRDICVRGSDTRIVMLVIDGLGGLPGPEGRSELETASLPHLDELCACGTTGAISPLGPGFTPGSGPAHLALFGYDPWSSLIGRGALSALGLGLDFRPGDVAARLNFCSVGADGAVTDRRAGRIPTELCAQMCEKLKAVSISGVEVRVAPEMDYRASMVFRGEGLSDGVTDSDPQVTGKPSLALRAELGSERMAEVAEAFLAQAGEILADESPANMVLIRGFGRYPDLPSMEEVYGLNATGIAGYPMYRGVARAVGMETPATSTELFAELDALELLWAEGKSDFFYVHMKKTDSAGEDGDFARKVALLEEVDGQIPRVTGLEPDVLVVTGDHSTPSVMSSHSWHSVPTVIVSPFAIPAASPRFDERSCVSGALGQIASTSLMALVLAHAQRLSKFGA